MYLKPVVLLVGLLVITAGCMDVLGTGVPADADGASGPGGSADDGPSAGGNDVELVENRTAALRAAGSYTSVWGMTYTQDGEVVGETSYTTAVDYANERSSFSMVQTNEGEVQTGFESYYADGTSYTRYSEDETYAVDDGAQFAPDRSLFAPDTYTHTAGDLAEYTRVGTETYDGVEVTRYELTERPAWLAQQAPDEEFTWTEFTYTVLVDDDGLVRFEGWTGEGVDDDGVTATMEYSYALTGVGSTVVEEPAWIDAARDQP